MNDRTETEGAARRARHEAIRAEVAAEEAEAAEAETAERAGALDVAMHLRIDRDLDSALRSLAEAEHIPTSALVRRLLRQAVQPRVAVLTVEQVEAIARRVITETAATG